MSYHNHYGRNGAVVFIVLWFIAIFADDYNLYAMADNYVEKQYEEFLRKKAAKESAKRAAWKKQLKEYQEKLKREKNSQQDK